MISSAYPGRDSPTCHPVRLHAGLSFVGEFRRIVIADMPCDSFMSIGLGVSPIAEAYSCLNCWLDKPRSILCNHEFMAFGRPQPAVSAPNRQLSPRNSDVDICVEPIASLPEISVRNDTPLAGRVGRAHEKVLPQCADQVQA